MANRIKITTNANEIVQRMEERVRRANNIVEKTVVRATFLVEGTVKQGIQGGPKSGGSVIRYHDGARVTHTVSAAGQYPATDTGFLVSNITSKIRGTTGEVTSSAEYSKQLEYGTRNMAARPFMFPSLEQNKPKILRMFKAAKLLRR